MSSLGMQTPPQNAPEVLRTMALAGLYDDLATRLLDATSDGWANILARGATFTWEVWNPSDLIGDSMSHGWGSPVTLEIQRSLLGVQPIRPGFSSLRRVPADRWAAAGERDGAHASRPHHRRVGPVASGRPRPLARPHRPAQHGGHRAGPGPVGPGRHRRRAAGRPGGRDPLRRHRSRLPAWRWAPVPTPSGPPRPRDGPEPVDPPPPAPGEPGGVRRSRRPRRDAVGRLLCGHVGRVGTGLARPPT